MSNMWSGYVLGGWKQFVYIVWSGDVLLRHWSDVDLNVYSLCRWEVLNNSWSDVNRDMSNMSN